MATGMQHKRAWLAGEISSRAQALGEEEGRELKTPVPKENSDNSAGHRESVNVEVCGLTSKTDAGSQEQNHRDVFGVQETLSQWLLVPKCRIQVSVGGKRMDPAMSKMQKKETLVV